MAASRSEEQLAELAAFVRRLYELGGFGTWKEMADAAGVHTVQISNYQRGVEEPSGWSLLSLIRATAARSGSDAESLSLRVARESFADRLALAAGRLERLGGAVDELLANQEEGLAKLTLLVERGEPGSGQRSSRAAPKR